MAIRVTLGTLDQKLESFMDLMKQHIESDRQDFGRVFDSLEGNGKPGIKTRIEILEREIIEIKASRVRQLTAVWSTLGTIIAALAGKFIIG